MYVCVHVCVCERESERVRENVHKYTYIYRDGGGDGHLATHLAASAHVETEECHLQYFRHLLEE